MNISELQKLALEHKTDLHTYVASGMFGVAIDQVTATQRGKAKMYTYPLRYSQQLEIKPHKQG